jgi:putative ABC transport system permease protein
MILRLVWENVRFRPMRTLLSLMLIGMSVNIILTLVGITQGFVADMRRRSAGTGADVMVRPTGSSFGTGTNNTIPPTYVGSFGKQPHVVVSTGIMQVAAGRVFDMISGIDQAAFERMSGGLDFQEGHGFVKPRDAIVDTDYAAQLHLHVGSQLKLQNQMWTVCGIVGTGKLGHIFVRLEDLRDVTGATGLGQIYLKVDRPENVDSVVAALKATPQLADYPIFSMKEWLDLTSVDNISGVSIFLDVIIGFGVCTCILVVLMSMYLAVLQRTREIGILKSLGATKRLVMTLVLGESIVAGIGGTIAGILLSFLARQVLKTFVPASLPVAIVIGWWPKAGAIAIASALVGALYPGWKAVRQDPIEALAHE